MVARQTVLFLCTGNTCRSPLAEALARLRYGESGTRFLSAGLQAWPGQPATEGSRQAAARRGASCERHESRALTPELLAEVDLVVAMTRAHADSFNARFPDFGGRVTLLGAPGGELEADEVDDPFGGDHDRYETMAAQVAGLLEAWHGIFAGEEPAS